MRLTGAELTIQLVEQQGIDIIAGIPGGANLPLYDALARRGTIRHILARHEQGAGFMAQGISRTLGTPAVCFATSGPGATNVLTAIADAKLDSVPIVCITGQVPSPLIGTDAFQEIDVFGMSIPATKHNYLVKSAMDLAEIIPEAFHIAMSGRPGPILIDIPKDVQLAMVDLPGLPAVRGIAPCPPVSAAQLSAILKYLEGAKRPVIYAGGGLNAAPGAQACRALAEKGSIPVTTTLMGLGVMPSGHPLNLGMLGMHGARPTNLLLEEADLLLVAGARFDDRATGRLASFCPDAAVIHIDIDPSELGKLRKPSLAVEGDATEVFERLIPGLRQRRRRTWLERLRSLRAEDSCGATEGEETGIPQIIRRIADCVGDTAIVATDVGQHQMWVAQYYPFQRPRQLLTSGGLGTMGFGLPTAIGAALANPALPVVCFSGDGSLLMNIQELATAVETGVNVKIVLLNNGCLGLVRQQQDLFYGSRLFASEFDAQPDFPRLAEAFGMPALTLPIDAPEDDLIKALTAPGPVLLNIPVRASAQVFPMVAPGGANRDMITSASG